MTARRRPGRPRLDEEDETVHLHVRLPSRSYDRADAGARREGVTLPEFVRRAVVLRLGVLSPKIDK